jgi:hypothetical protein
LYKPWERQQQLGASRAEKVAALAAKQLPGQSQRDSIGSPHLSALLASPDGRAQGLSQGLSQVGLGLAALVFIFCALLRRLLFAGSSLATWVMLVPLLALFLMRNLISIFNSILLLHLYLFHLYRYLL